MRSLNLHIEDLLGGFEQHLKEEMQVLRIYRIHQ